MSLCVCVLQVHRTPSPACEAWLLSQQQRLPLRPQAEAPLTAPAADNLASAPSSMASSSAASSATRARRAPAMHLRGSASGALEPGASAHDERAVVGLAHTRRVGAAKAQPLTYTHYFFRRRATPPFDLLGISAPFRFPSFVSRVPGGGAPRADGIQFCLSLRFEGDGGVALDFGAGDMAALTVRVSRFAYCNFTRWC